MAGDSTVVDRSSPAAISAAIKRVNSTPGLRIEPGIKALWKLHRAPNHSMLRSEMDAQFGALDLHFGWFCRRVAEELGANNPDPLALVDYSADSEGRQVLTLKPAVVAALPKI